jgi:NodT family efflux transporter outer membrane factor (OMF) lipoprotein
MACGLSLLFAACASNGPAYQRPVLTLPADYEAPAPFHSSDPKDALPKGVWWTMFGDAELDALETQALAANSTIEVAAAQYEQARALTRDAMSSLYPQVATSPSVLSQRLSGSRAGAAEAATQSTFSVPLTARYEVDLFGKRARSIETAQLSAESSAAVLENVRLIVAADLAADYLSIRRLDAEADVLNRTVEVLQRALDLVRNRNQGGIASGLDVAQEEALLAATRTQATLLQQDRDRLEHAVAILVGQPAPAFHVPVRAQTVVALTVGLGIPSDLLERRPDVAAAERLVAVANARVGLARRAYFPSLNLLGSAGWESGSLLKLLDVPSMVWAVGATLTEDVFTGGARKARVDYEVAGFKAAAASYRETVLEALADVQDAVSDLDVLDRARTTQAAAVAASQRALDIANNRYSGGLASALDLVSAQQTLLENQRLAVQLDGSRLVSFVALVKALGGGWEDKAGTRH